MSFDISQIANARTSQIYQGLKDDGVLKTSMTDIVCQVVPTSGIAGHAGKISTLDFQAIAPTNALTGFKTMGTDATELTTPMSDRVYEIQEISHFKEYPRAMDKDKLFQKVKNSFVPHLQAQIEFDKDDELNSVLSGAGTSSTNSQDVTVRALSLAASEQWTDPASTPLSDLRDAAQDSLADSLFLGLSKANQLRDHDDFQSQTGYKNATASQLAEYLADYLGIQRVIIGNRIFQDGAQSAAADIQRVSSSAVCAFNSANILYLDWTSAEFEHDETTKNNRSQLYGRANASIVVVNPLYAIAFTDVA